MKFEKLLMMMINIHNYILFHVYFVSALFLPEKYFIEQDFQYIAAVDNVSVCRRLTRVAEFCNYNQRKIILWLSLFSYIWKLETVYIVNQIQIAIPEFDPPTD